ncbi:hypothetical protein Dsin_014489 [Dipteronia sinensis]|uniref:Uncharacterized protein n=1 Tax=Dipteronia sinensis TaxID=43782 RepID=A0AAE0AN53_9ROSI|nr:hypothetical protein Dsin_014489 [Dipteronia sinensis]
MVKYSRSASSTTVKTCLRKGAWSLEEDQKLKAYIHRYGIRNWVVTPKAAGLLRTGKSCRLRWMNYLRPSIKHGNFSHEEDETIIKLHQQMGNRWSTIASGLTGRTDNEIKNHWHTNLKNYSMKNNNLLQEAGKDQIEIDQKTPPEDDDILLYNPPKQSNINADCSPSSSSGDQPAGVIYNQIIEENSGSSETYVELQSLWDPVPAELFPMDYGTTHGFLFPNSLWGFQGNTSTLASYYDAGDDVSAYLLMQVNEESV